MPRAKLSESGEKGARAEQTARRTRIQAENSEKILAAALEVFASEGFRGATIDRRESAMCPRLRSTGRRIPLLTPAWVRRALSRRPPSQRNTG